MTLLEKIEKQRNGDPYPISVPRSQYVEMEALGLMDKTIYTSLMDNEEWLSWKLLQKSNVIIENDDIGILYPGWFDIWRIKDINI